jgi:hypothetical protein
MPEVAAGFDAFVAADPAGRIDLGMLTREYTSGLDADGSTRLWGGLRGVVVRRPGRTLP